MKKYRTKSDWLALIDEFEQSGLTQTKFHAQRGLNAKYFSLRRMNIKAQPESTGFTQAVVGRPHVTDQVTLNYSAVTIKLSASNAQTIAQLVKALAALSIGRRISRSTCTASRWTFAKRSMD